ncbi:MAG: hypothetical protein JRF15_09240 [Deltaproteobacteria bacterium]|jgi:hypothetical protein|nr:hypothetical protein [Deltaproteobacteria bacterium]
MTTLAIELNDASIAVARSDQLLATEPGCAIETADGIAFGDAARRSSRLRPRDANDRYWADLGVGPLARPLASAKSAADLAHAQLLQLWKRFGEATDEVLLAVPGSFDRAKLGLLLGIADACEMPVAGLVDAAVAACSRPYPGWDSVHVEAELHGFGLTRIGHARRDGGDEAVAEGFEIAIPTGIARLYERWARRIAAAFIAQTRFDPLSDGKTEQRLFDALPGWLEAFGGLPAATVEFDLDRATRSIRLERRDIVAEAADVYDQLADRVSAARRPGRGLAVRVGPVLAGLPGAKERFGQIAGVRVVALSAGAGALGALACASDIRSTPGQTTLIRSVAWREPADPLPALRCDELDDSVPEATHLLLRDTAHPIGERRLELRVAESGRLQIVAEGRADFALRRSETGLQLDCAEGSGVSVNASPAGTGTRLRSGDRISVANSAEEARLIAVKDDGA